MEKNSYPSVNNLLRQASEQNTTISLRIKDSTRSAFEILARKDHLNLSSVINTLLDDYAENYINTTLQQDQADKQSLRRHIENIARKAGSLNPEILFLDIANEYRPDALLEQHYALFPGVSIDEYARDFATWASNHPTHFFQSETPYIYFADGIIHAINPFQEASVATDYTTTKANVLDGIDLKCLDLYLPAWQWAIVVTIISATESKEKVSQRTPIGETALRQIAYLANTVKDNAEFAQLVGKILIRAKGLEYNETSENTSHVENNPVFAPKNANRTLTWGAICVAALESLDGTAHVSSIYPACRQIAVRLGKPITNKNENSFNMSIQGTLESCSKDCNPSTKRDYFRIVEKGTGMWQLNPGVHFDWNSGRVITQNQ